MWWLIPAVSANFFWSITNVIDKYIVANRVKNPYIFMSWLWLLTIVFVLLIPFVNFYVPEAKLFFWLVAAGVICFLASFPYIKAMQMEEVTRINIWWNIMPIFSLVIAWLTIGQKLNLGQLLALFLLLTGAILGGIHIRRGGIAFSKAVWWLIFSCFLYTIYAVIFSFVSRLVPFVVALIWINIVGFTCALLLFLSKKFRNDFMMEWKTVDSKLFGTVLLVSMLEHVAQFFNVWALSVGLAALVYAMEGFQAIFVFVIAMVVSFFKPLLLKEEMDRGNLFLKLAGVLFMAGGVAVVNLW